VNYSRAQLERLKKKELKEILRGLNERIQGPRRDLIQRILNCSQGPKGKKRKILKQVQGAQKRSKHSPFDEAKVHEVFNRYVHARKASDDDDDDDEHDPDAIEENILQLFEDLELPLDDVAALVFMWNMECKYPDRIYRHEFVAGMRRLNCNSIEDMKSRLPGLRALLSVPESFSEIYSFAFRINLEAPKKILDKDAALTLWDLLLPGQRYPLMKAFVDYLVSRSDITFISRDLWNQVRLFVTTMDEDLSKFDEDGAWPVVIDDFVQATKEK
jgi:DCN1-like protein 1/2